MMMKVELSLLERWYPFKMSYNMMMHLNVCSHSDEDLEIDLVEEEPPFLRGQTKWSTNMSPVKIVKVVKTFTSIQPHVDMSKGISIKQCCLQYIAVYIAVLSHWMRCGFSLLSVCFFLIIYYCLLYTLVL